MCGGRSLARHTVDVFVGERHVEGVCGGAQPLLEVVWPEYEEWRRAREAGARSEDRDQAEMVVGVHVRDPYEAQIDEHAIRARAEATVERAEAALACVEHDAAVVRPGARGGLRRHARTVDALSSRARMVLCGRRRWSLGLAFGDALRGRVGGGGIGRASGGGRSRRAMVAPTDLPHSALAIDQRRVAHLGGGVRTGGGEPLVGEP